MHVDRRQTRRFERVTKAVGRTDREANALVVRRSTGIHRDRRVEEPAYQVHPSGVIPDVGSHGAAGGCNPPHLPQPARDVRDEVEDEAGDDDVDRSGLDWQGACIGDREANPRVGLRSSRDIDEVN